MHRSDPRYGTVKISDSPGSNRAESSEPNPQGKRPDRVSTTEPSHCSKSTHAGITPTERAGRRQSV
jgi:hypothetical protein